MFVDIMQVCIKGHIITRRHIFGIEDSFNHCQECGSKTITECQNCGKSIPGDSNFSEFNIYVNRKLPLHCHHCNKSYPWNKGLNKLKRKLNNIPKVKINKIASWTTSLTVLGLVATAAYTIGNYTSEKETIDLIKRNDKFEETIEVLQDSVNVLSNNKLQLEKSIKDLEFEKESYKHQKEIYNNALKENGIVLDTSN